MLGVDISVRTKGRLAEPREPLDVRSIRSIIATCAAAAGIPRPGQWSLAAGGSAQSLAAAGAGAGGVVAGRRLEGAADAGPLRAAPVHRPWCGRQAALPGRSVEGRQGARRARGSKETRSRPGKPLRIDPRVRNFGTRSQVLLNLQKMFELRQAEIASGKRIAERVQPCPSDIAT